MNARITLARLCDKTSLVEAGSMALSMTVSRILCSIIAVLVISIVTPIIFIVFVQTYRIHTAKVPTQIPWVGLKNKRWFPKLRATFREVTAKRGPVEEGYEKVRILTPAPRNFPSFRYQPIFSMERSTNPTSSPPCTGLRLCCPLPTSGGLSLCRRAS